MRIYDFCMTSVLHFAPFMIKLMVEHMGDTFPILTDLNYSYPSYHFETIPFILTNHSSMQMEKSIITTTGTFTRVKLSLNKINKSYHRNLRIAQLIPWLFLPT